MRGVLVGMVLCAYLGMEYLARQWAQGIKAGKKIEMLLEKID